MFLGLTLSGDEFVADVFWTYLLRRDVFSSDLFRGAGVLRPGLDLTFLPRGPAQDSLGLLGLRAAPFGF